MKTPFLFFAIAVLFLFSGNSIIAQNIGLTAKISKTEGSIFTSNNNGKHLLSFEISGIENQKHADNLIKFIRGYRGVEEFNMIPIAGTSNWQASGIFYEFSDIPYFKNMFKLMKVSQLVIDNVNSDVDNLN
ncbi:MAG: hypothetical protein HY951_14450 [Bacteroidia bacterium]|nr:hypothetical protein [Bacteroidia bacterium]